MRIGHVETRVMTVIYLFGRIITLGNDRLTLLLTSHYGGVNEKLFSYLDQLDCLIKSI